MDVLIGIPCDHLFSVVGGQFGIAFCPQAYGVGCGKIVRYVGLCHPAGGRPFGASLEGEDEARTLQLVGGMTQDRVEYPAFAVTDSEQYRLILAAAAFFLVGKGRRQ